MRDLRIGIVGLGWFGSIHRAVWRQLPGALVVAICDSLSERLEGPGDAAQESFHRDPGVVIPPIPSERAARYTSVEDLLETESVDLLDIVTPEASHFSVAAKALSRGISVMIEKPFVTDSVESKELIALSRKHGGLIYVGHILRFDTRHRALAENVHASGYAVRHLSLQRHFQGAAHAIYGRCHPFYGAMVHDIDLALWLTRERPKRVLGMTTAWRGGETPDALTAILDWGSGLRAILQNTWHLAASCPYGFDFESKVFTDGCTYVIRNEPVLQVWNDTTATVPDMFLWPSINGARSGAIRDELSHVLQCARERVDSQLVPLTDVSAGIDIANALVRSANSEQWEDVEYVG